jgi:hypothetical protein
MALSTVKVAWMVTRFLYFSMKDLLISIAISLEEDRELTAMYAIVACRAMSPQPWRKDTRTKTTDVGARFAVW